MQPMCQEASMVFLINFLNIYVLTYHSASLQDTTLSCLYETQNISEGW